MGFQRVSNLSKVSLLVRAEWSLDSRVLAPSAASELPNTQAGREHRARAM